jgi:hypothetical protein
MLTIWSRYRRSDPGGYGSGLLCCLREYAAAEGCSQLHLDSGIQRKNAHRFYEREGLTMTGLRYVEQIFAAGVDSAQADGAD